jgi:hypothetical protein
MGKRGEFADQLSGLRVVDPVLTNLARGYSNGESIAESCCPVVNVELESATYIKFGKEVFRLYNTERAPRGASNRMSAGKPSNDKYVMTEHDLEYPIDYRENAEAAFPLQRYATFLVTQGILLRREKICADLCSDPGNYAATNKLALAGDDCFSEPGSDVVGVITDAKEAMRSQIAKRPNCAHIGPATLNAWKKHPQFLARIGNNENKVVTLDIIKEVLEIPEILVGEMIYTDDNDTPHDIWGDIVHLCYKPMSPQGQERTMYEPSFGYTFRKRGKPVVDTYVTNGGKVQLVRNTDLLDVKIVGADAGFLITNTVK